jgi:hypothetical protein
VLSKEFCLIVQEAYEKKYSLIIILIKVPAEEKIKKNFSELNTMPERRMGSGAKLCALKIFSPVSSRWW